MLLIPKIPVDKITEIMVRFYKRIGGCYFNKEDIEISVEVGELENGSKAIRILNSVKLLSKIIILLIFYMGHYTTLRME